MITAFTEVLGFFFPEHHASGGAYTRPPGHANRTRPCSCPLERYAARRHFGEAR